MRIEYNIITYIAIIKWVSIRDKMHVTVKETLAAVSSNSKAVLAIYFLPYHFANLVIVLFRGEITPLSSSYNISGLVPVCWLLFECF